ncbi:MAG: pelota-like protein [Acidilobaceae archaeon]|nr:pelota-like protein [Acidilobaceae archaeon]
MRVLEVHPNRRAVTVRIDTEEDLWTLRTLLKPGDVVEGKTARDVVSGRGEEKERRVITVKLRLKAVEFQPFTGRLRLFGTIIEGPEEYGVVGKHHSMTLQPGATVTLEREEGWSERAIEKMRGSGPRGRAIVVAVDYEEYALAVLSASGYKVLEEGLLRLPGKDDARRERALEEAMSYIAQRVAEAAGSHGASVIVAVGPGFLKEELADKIRALAPSAKVYSDSASMGGAAGVEEALRRQSTLEHLRELSIAEAERFLGEFMELLARERERVAYGLGDVWAAARAGAVRELLVLDSALYDLELGERAAKAVEEAEAKGALVTFVPEESPPGQRLKALGGLAAILRYPLPEEARRLSG